MGKSEGQPSSIWKIALFGPLCVERGHRRITRFSTYKTAALLAYLACATRRSYRREELIELLWPDYELESGRNCLSMALTFLRRQLESEPEDRGRVIQADRTE